MFNAEEVSFWDGKWVDIPDHIDLKDTIITSDYVDQISEEDYVYYYAAKEVRVPAIAYRYRPAPETVFYMYGTKDQERMIYPFDGYSDEEEGHYQKFIDYLAKQDEELPPELNKRRTMRFLTNNRYNWKNTWKNIKTTLKFREEMYPVILTDSMKVIIESGLIYLHGRDRCFRPVLWAQGRVLTDNDFDLDEAIKVSFFFLRYGQEFLTMPGKIENWVQITDMHGVNVWKIPLRIVYRYIHLFQTNIKWRWVHFININVGFAVRTVWNIVKSFVDVRLRNKILLTKDNTHPKIFEMINPKQLEQRFQGEAPNLTRYWPPTFVWDDYGHDPAWIIDEGDIEDYDASNSDSFRVCDRVHKLNSKVVNSQKVDEVVDLDDIQVQADKGNVILPKDGTVTKTNDTTSKPGCMKKVWC